LLFLVWFVFASFCYTFFSLFVSDCFGFESILIFKGYVFSKRAEKKEKEGFYEAAESLYQRAFDGIYVFLSSVCSSLFVFQRI
jgi:hypothetical protein